VVDSVTGSPDGRGKNAFVANAFVTTMFATNTFVKYSVGVTAPPRGRRDRPAKAPLSREGIVDAAMAVLATDGVERLTMRRLAADLDTGPASLYVYVRNTTELHALVLDRLLAEMDLAWDGRTDWRRRLRTVLTDYVDLLAQHPGLARSAVVVWPDGINYLDLLELVLTLLTAGGVPADRATWGVDILLQLATAMAAEYSTRGHAATQPLAQLANTLDNATAQRHPLLHRMGPTQMLGGARQARRDWALDAAINGIAHTPREEEPQT
jgi:AcrR family transcriptional regulator